MSAARSRRRFASTGTPAFFVHPSEASHGDLGMITPDDVIMALSWSGETAELKDLTDYSRRFRIGLIAVTADAGQHAGAGRRRRARAAAGARGLPAQSRAHDLDPDAAGARRRARDRAAGEPRLHGARIRRTPSGRPARRACSNSCATSCTAATRCRSSPLGTRMSDALVEMTAKSFGCVGITDRRRPPAGIITDGDLRRHMSPICSSCTVETIMTARPEDGAARSARQRGARDSQLARRRRS